MTTDEDDQDAETKCFRQTHDDVAVARPANHVRHVIGTVDFEHEDGDEISGGDSDCHALRY